MLPVACVRGGCSQLQACASENNEAAKRAPVHSGGRSGRSSGVRAAIEARGKCGRHALFRAMVTPGMRASGARRCVPCSGLDQHDPAPPARHRQRSRPAHGRDPERFLACVIASAAVHFISPFCHTVLSFPVLRRNQLSAAHSMASPNITPSHVSTNATYRHRSRRCTAGT